ncbi:host attachment protein (plasmid) [Pseudorhodobacter turbinis]|uniref:Host attachment protein n=1 Tax=Pseudorhodobacter turbinis TaxID=2500533 RepID=A0A4P8ELJ0_9RHOB|nr:host attachment family protein [Pseudorhodobacter turbinis]QCO57762.1 host attachment protein [Pseudorhodobacter turbinis]
MAKLKNGGWVLVADGEKALFLINDGDENNLDLRVIRKDEQENPSTREQGANRPGSVQSSAGHDVSAMDDTDWHELAKERFAVDLADLLYSRAHAGRFDQLVIVAAPQILGVLRASMHSTVSGKVLTEIPKHLTNQPLDKIEKQVAAAVAEAA